MVRSPTVYTHVNKRVCEQKVCNKKSSRIGSLPKKKATNGKRITRSLVVSLAIRGLNSQIAINMKPMNKKSNDRQLIE